MFYLRLVTLSYSTLLIAGILLGTPVYLFLSSDILQRVFNTQGADGFLLSRLAATWQNWMDLLRAFAGAWLLSRQVFVLDPAWDEGVYVKFAVVGGILAAGVAVQVVYYSRHIYCLCPVFYLAGVSFGLVDWWIALYGLLAGLFFGAIANSTEAFFLSMAITIAIAGYFFHGISPEWVVACVLLVLPVSIALSIHESLISVIRRRPVSVE